MKSLKHERLAALRAKAEAALQQQENSDPAERASWHGLLHDLAVYQIELEMQNEELTRTQALLEQARDSYARLFNEAPAGYLVLDERGCILQTNQTFHDMRGQVDDRLRGKPFHELLAEGDREIFLGRYGAFFRSPEGKNIEVRLCRRDGSRLYVQLRGHSEVPGPTDMNASRTLLLIVTDIDALKRSQLSLEASESRYRSLFQNNHAVMLLIDPDNGRIVDANPAACDYYGYPHAALTQLSISTINILPASELRSKMGSACRRERQHFFFRHRLASGAERDVEVYSGPIVVDGRDLLYSIVHDISERRAAENALEEARTRAEAASRSKGEFLANMSHEIRTPLTGLLGNLQLLQQTGLTAEQRELVNTALFSGASLQTVVNDILDLSKLEAGKMTLSRDHFDLSELLRELLAVFRPQATSRGLTLESVYPSTLPRWFYGDASRIRQILFNLIGNAVKFTDSGTVRVVVAHYVTTATGGELTLQVSDTGIGIPAELQEQIFEPFTQVDASSRRRHQGTGLGLSIVRRLAEQMEGQILLTSTPGVGTTVTVCVALDIAPAVALPAQDNAAGVTASSAGPLTILVVEDNQVNLMLAKRILEQDGHRVFCVDSGQGAIELLRRQPVDLVFMDIQMPELDGFATLRLLRQDPALLVPQVPVVAMTAHALAEDRERCVAAGFDGYLAKPFSMAEMRDAVERYRPATTGQV